MEMENLGYLNGYFIANATISPSLDIYSQNM